MALTTKRIIALPSQTDPQEGDYLAIDNAGSGTHKIPVGRIGVEVDDTLTEAGKAADAKAVGDALDEIRSQIEVTGTASGAIATFADGSDNPMKSCIVTIEPQQSGTGTPSPSNVRPISGWESVNLYKSGKNLLKVDSANTVGRGITQTLNEDGTITLSGTSTSAFNGQAINGSAKFILPAGTYRFVDVGQTSGATFYYYLRVQGNSAWIQSGQTFTVPEGSSGCWIVLYFPTNTEVSGTHGLMIVSENSTYDTYESYTGTTTPVNLGRTAYGGTLDVVTGVLTAYPFYPSYNGETLDGRWICDRAVYAKGTTPPTGSQVALISGTGTTYQLTPTEVNTLLGENNVWADSGDVEVVYVRDLNIAINNLLNSNGTRSLGMMAMSAPTEATAEEPTDEQSDEDMR